VTKFEIDTTLNMSVDEAWANLSNPEVYRRMYLEGLDFVACTVEVLDDGPQFRMRTEATPKVQLPGPIRKIIGDKSSYTETVHWDREAGAWKWSIALAATNRVKISGVMTMRPSSDGTCIRHIDGAIEAKIFGVGGLMEKTVRDQVHDNYDRAGRFLNSLA
jgi:hypothetical protein